MTKLILIRHGETEANERQVWYGSLDAPLTARGERQVMATASHMANFVKEHPIDAFYVSPLDRTRKTAAAISQKINISPTVLDGLREFCLGDWEGRSLQALQDEEDLWVRWKAEPKFAPPNGESPHSFGNRSLEIARYIVDTHPDQTVLAVTHGGIICNILSEWIGDGMDDWAKWEPHCCGIAMLEGKGQHWQASLINSIDHLPIDSVVYDVPLYSKEFE